MIILIVTYIKRFFSWLFTLLAGKTNYDKARLIMIAVLLGALLFLFIMVKSCISDYSLRQKQKEEQKINANIANAEKNITILETEANMESNIRQNINSNIDKLNSNINKSQSNISNIKNRNKNVTGRELDEKANNLY